MNAQQGRPSRLPRMAVIAERIRGGTTIDALAAEFAASVGRVRTLLNDGGWDRDGQPKTTYDRPRAVFVRDDQPWADQALCAQIGGDAWYPDKGAVGREAENSIREAKAVCGRCPVRIPCLEYALANDERYGIYGGLSERERRKIKKAGDRA